MPVVVTFVLTSCQKTFLMVNTSHMKLPAKRIGCMEEHLNLPQWCTGWSPSRKVTVL